ncbi:MAG: hypothetical protein CMB95_07105 [Flavobacteriaceae bacterium]|nr:hypothetical protein [Flavobacteriaceae bacterium]
MEWIEARPIIADRLGITEEALGLILDEVFEDVEPEDEVQIVVETKPIKSSDNSDFTLTVDSASLKRFLSLIRHWGDSTAIQANMEGLAFTNINDRIGGGGRPLGYNEKGTNFKVVYGIDGPFESIRTISEEYLRDTATGEDGKWLKGGIELPIPAKTWSNSYYVQDIDVEEHWPHSFNFEILKPTEFMKNLKTAAATTSRIQFTTEDFDNPGKLVMICSNGGVTGEVFRVIYDQDEVKVLRDTPNTVFDSLLLNKIMQNTCRKGQTKVYVADSDLTVTHITGTKEKIWMCGTLVSL